MIRFEIPGQPQGKARPKVTLRGSFAHAYTPKKTVEYEDLIRLSYKQQCDKFYSDKPLAVTVLAFHTVPKSFTKKKKEDALTGKLRPQTKPDFDNVFKVVCDALSQVAYIDDKQIVQAHFCRHYSMQPKVVVMIEEVKYFGFEKHSFVSENEVENK